MAGVATIVREVLNKVLDEKLDPHYTYRDRHPHYYRVKVRVSEKQFKVLSRKRTLTEALLKMQLPDLIEATPYTWEVGCGYGRYGWLAGISYGFVVKVKRQPLPK